MKEIKAIIFDIYGVLSTLEDYPFCEAIAKETGKSFKEVEEAFLRYLEACERNEFSEEEHYKKMFSDLKIEFDLEKAKELRLKFREEIPGMRELVEKLKEKYFLAYVSNDSEGPATRAEEKFGWSKLFQAGIIAYQVGFRKNTKELFQALLDKINFKAEECIFLDDSEKNLLKPKEMGMTTIHYKNKEQLIEELKKLGVKI